jgi:hypothetical protein
MLPALQYVHRRSVDKSSSSPYLRLASMAVSFSAQALVSGDPVPAGCSGRADPAQPAWWRR